jgi:ceramide glucosyltransferase
MTFVLLALLAGALVYSLLSIVAAFRYLRVRPPELVSPEAISILKPLYGLDDGLESNLRTFFEQDYPVFEILFDVCERRMTLRSEWWTNCNANIPTSRFV